VSHPVFNASGELLELVGTAVDVTERKRAERTFSKARGDTDTSSRWSAYPSGKKISLGSRRRSTTEADGVEDFREYVAAHPEFVTRRISMVKIVDVNDVTLELFAADSKDELLVSLDKIFVLRRERSLRAS